MAVYRRSSRPRYVLVLLILTSVTLLTLDFRGSGQQWVSQIRNGARELFAPLQSATDAAVEPLQDVFGGIFNYGDLKNENARLRDELEEARSAAARATDADRERRVLLDLQDLDYVGDIPTVSARIVGQAANNFEFTVVIDRGTSHGVDEGMPVVAGAGLVGRVIESSATRSTVLLVTDRGSRVGIRLSASGDVGVARGQGVGRAMVADLIDPASVVERDEVVVTSGLQQGLFPAGIPVALVKSAKSEPGALRQDVTLTPVVDLDRLAYVKVLQYLPPGDGEPQAPVEPTPQGGTGEPEQPAGAGPEGAPPAGADAP